MAVMLAPAAQKHLLTKAVEQGSLKEILMPEYTWQPTANTAQVCRDAENTNAKSALPSLHLVKCEGRKGLLGHDMEKGFLASRLCNPESQLLYAEKLFFREREPTLTLSEAGDLQAKASQQAEMIR